MKRILLIISLFAFYLPDYGQNGSIGIIDTNNIAAGFSNGGGLFYPGGFRMTYHDNNSTIPVPYAIYYANVWVAGRNNGTLFNSSEIYTSPYQAGPCGTQPQDTSKWDNMWLISRADVLAVKNDFDNNHAITIPLPASVVGWPAKGNANAMGNGGTLVINEDMAPFYDRNGDGIYNVYDGDYPMMRGDQMLWWINNDAGSQSQNPMGIDRRYSVYEYECTGDSNLDNTLFLSVSIKNRSNHVYDSVIIGTYAQMELGCVNSDRAGSIPYENSFYTYKGYVLGANQQNGVTCDEASVCPTSEVGYGCNLPIISATFLNDTMRCFEYITNGASNAQTFPATDQEYYHYMNGQWNDGTPMTYGGTGYGGTVPYPFAFSGNPADTLQWSAVYAGVGMSNDIAAIGPFSLGVGDTISFDMAFIFHQDSFNNTPDISDSSIVNRHIDSIRRYYAAENFPCWFDSSKSLAPAFYNVGINEVTPSISFSVIPNPNTGNFQIHLSNQPQGSCNIIVTDMIGRIVYKATSGKQDMTVHMPDAENGAYTVTIRSQNSTVSKQIILMR
jgi:hypothetical protein